MTLSTAPLRVSGDVSHRNAMFIAKCNFVKKKILDYIGPGWELAMIPCSGTGAVEAMISNAYSESGECNVFQNGSYGQRLTEIAHKYFGVYEHAYAQPRPMPITDFMEIFPGKKIRWNFMVHGETSTGVLNDIDKALKYCDETKGVLGIDAVATFGMERIPFANERLGMVAFSSCKGLAVAPGMGFVAYKKSLVKRPDKGYYLDLQRWSTEELPFTPTTEAMEELYNKFHAFPHFLWQAMGKYEIQSRDLRNRLRDIGFNLVVDDDKEAMRCVTVVQLDNKEEKDNLVKFCWMNGIELYGKEKQTVKISMLNMFNEFLPGFTDSSDFAYFIDVLWRWKNGGL